MKKAPTRAAPHPPIPRRPDQKSLQAEATTCRDPGSVYCPGFLFVAVKTLFCRCADFAGVCVALATVALIHEKRGPAFELASRLESSYSLLNLLVIYP
jgi:hypothetical protein